MSQLAPVFADCVPAAGAERVIGIFLPPMLLLLWGFAAFLILRAGPWRDRGLLLVILIACAAIGAWFTFGLPRTEGGEQFRHFQLGLAASAGIGLLATAFVRQIERWRLLGAALAGAVSVPGGIVMLFIWAFALGNTCLD